MPEYVVLDSEAVSTLAHPRERGVSARRAQAVLVAAERRSALIRIPAAVLVEVYRGGPRDAAIDRVVNVPERVVATDARVARLAGRMLGRRKLEPRHAVDAIVVATAAALGSSVILTGDPNDLRRLAVEHPHVVVVPLP
jgi:predicted nucleic acid-binding protein